ncbi:MAG TPA: hypothetical protein VG940_13140 [Gemmatimonadales bacterium]|nr:hypothetical protein [Gemmatimonadales bacterium]
MTNDQRPTEAPAAAPRSRWLPSYQQVRLFVLLAALTVGITGMTRGDSRLVNIGIAIALVGVVMRLFNRKRPPVDPT